MGELTFVNTAYLYQERTVVLNTIVLIASSGVLVLYSVDVTSCVPDRICR